jgi:hypothetical protein
MRCQFPFTSEGGDPLLQLFFEGIFTLVQRRTEAETRKKMTNQKKQKPEIQKQKVQAEGGPNDSKEVVWGT